ncbi:MAG: hypothetical protein JNK43_11030, partial [Ignavibacteria bacterium]|nr:hypothetical protein [Ignavibacteria bacterium]
MEKGSSYFKILSAVVLLMMAGLNSCGSGNYSRLQGKWGASGNTGDSTDMNTWFIKYEFDAGSYKMSGYPPISEEGTIEIVEEKGDSIQVYFNVTKSSPE